VFNVITEKLEAPHVNLQMIKGFAGIKNSDTSFDLHIKDCLDVADGCFSYNVCYSELPLTINENEIDIGFAKITSQSLAHHLFGCESVIVFAACVGIGIDRLISKYSIVSPTKALLFQAIGAERIEMLCNGFNSKLEQNYLLSGKKLRTRFSPGYGDLPLELQSKIIEALGTNKRIGLSLTNGLVMCPSKSVTAIIGVEKSFKAENV